MTVDKLMWTITNTSDTEETKEERLERIQYLGNEIGKAENRRDALEMKWLDGKITDSDHDRLCSTITKNIETYKTELNSLQEQLTKESESDSTGIETRLAYNILKHKIELPLTDTGLITVSFCICTTLFPKIF